VKEKFPIRIINTPAAGRFKMTTSIGRLEKNSRNVGQELAFLEKDYFLLIKTVKDAATSTYQNRRVDPRIYWLIGDGILRFLERVDDLGFYLVNQNDTLARDTNIAKSTIGRIISFRRRFPKLSMVNAAIPWTEYANNKVPAPK